MQCFDSIDYEHIMKDQRVLLCGCKGELSEGIEQALTEQGGHVIRHDYDAGALSFGAWGDALSEKALGCNHLVYVIPPVCYCSVMDTEEADFIELFQNSVIGLHKAFRTCLPAMIAQNEGTVAAISSDYALTAVSNVSAYSAASGAVNAYIRAIAIEYSKFNIRANSVLCGFNTADNGRIYAELHGDAAAKSAFARYQPIERAGKVQDIANAVLFCSSGMSNFITGEFIPVNGGALAVGHSQIWHPEGEAPFVFPRKEEQ